MTDLVTLLCVGTIFIPELSPYEAPYKGTLVIDMANGIVYGDMGGQISDVSAGRIAWKDVHPYPECHKPGLWGEEAGGFLDRVSGKGGAFLCMYTYSKKRWEVGALVQMTCSVKAPLF